MVIVAVAGSITGCHTSADTQVHIDGRTGRVQGRKFFDTFAEPGTKFLQFVQQLSYDDIVAVASSDDAFNMLARQGRSAFRLLGSTQISMLNYRGNIALIGRRGLWQAYAENVSVAVHGTQWGWAPVASASACVTLGKARLAVELQREAARTVLCRGSSV